jgi:hypothetical protein
MIEFTLIISLSLEFIDFLLCGSYMMSIVRFSLSLLLSGTLPVQAVAGVAKF